MFAGEIVASLRETDAHIRFGDGAVARVGLGHRDAIVAARIENGQAERTPVGAACAVFEPVTGLLLAWGERIARAFALRASKARDPQIAGAAVERVDMQRNVLVTDIDARRLRALQGRRPVAEIYRAGHRLGKRFTRDARIDDVHYPAHRIAAVEQCRWPAHDLDPIDRERIDPDGVVDAGARGIEHSHPILEDANAIAVQATDHRPARVRAVARAGYADLAREHVAKRRCEQPLQLGLLEDRHRGNESKQITAERDCR